MSMRKRIFLIHMLMLIGGMAILFAVIFGSVRQGIRGYMDSGNGSPMWKMTRRQC